MIRFNYRGRSHTVYINDVRCYPQAYAAAATMMDRLVESPRDFMYDGRSTGMPFLRLRTMSQALKTAFLWYKNKPRMD